VSLAVALVGMPAFRNKLGLIKERMKPGPGAKTWDRIVVALYRFLILIVFVTGVLDAGRYRWSPSIPIVVYALSYLAILAFTAFAIWAMLSNEFFSSLVRIQTDRGHTVVTSGPYRYVRHPGYLGLIVVSVCTGPVLGSVWALIPSGLAASILILRTVLEDATLEKDLPGYAEYTETVRFRLVPFIW